MEVLKVWANSAPAAKLHFCFEQMPPSVESALRNAANLSEICCISK
jgi:hypothetical protein